ncbi:uncharacterized protein LOC111705003 isoform X2 [Eurytemora carolleeae]|uniref:uncharacterized protein LOC111705003 isoform X2 n=1 Tax=Eurytemora carolleeae TaxID=1294199 RepID=UPI000C771F46|nr:uncharacterized protein LOC111705003 isoform X2 [Eurytemora carolleeae]|eukprot:XP_023333197.1 uncharacterized protein LOC111705003 isoform X2 [Eurytemora affinis]
MTGTCLSPLECNQRGGTAEGSCASGFGICCVLRLESCGGQILNNVTQVQNPGYPSKYKTAGSCTYIFRKQSEDICQIRLDFKTGTFSYSSKGTTGCIPGTTDVLSFTLKNKVPYSKVCGELTGQHMYYEVGSPGDTVTLDISLVGSVLERKWNILATQIACADPWRAPTDCLQYHTGPIGSFQSFNFASGQLLSSQNYRICFRQELRYCSISYRPSSLPSPPNPFLLPTSNPGGTTTTNNCVVAYLGIPVGGDSGFGDSKANRYCGNFFDSSEGATRNGQVSAAVTPFDVFVFSDALTLDKSGRTGFNMNYRQNVC